MINEIIVSGAREHNLKNINVRIPKNTFTVITGPSGSGKSSLAFDTIYVEGQRRYIESLPSYARQFLGQLQPPDVDSIDGLSPSIAIEQKSTVTNPRSTVGTITEIYDYLRILFARIGTLYCVDTGVEIKNYSPTRIMRILEKYPEKTKIQILAPIKITKQTNSKNIISKYLSMGFTKGRIKNEIFMLDEIDTLQDIETFEIVVDRIIVKPNISKRIFDSVEYGLQIGNGTIYVIADNNKPVVFSEKNISPETMKEYPPLTPKLFSFNSPIGACHSCNGLGKKQGLDKNLMITDPSLSIFEGAIKPVSQKNSFIYKMLINVFEQEGLNINAPLNSFPESTLELIFQGSDKKYNFSFKSQNTNFNFNKKFPGIVGWLNNKYNETTSKRTKKELEQYMTVQTCSECMGYRLNPIALSTRIHNKNIMELSEFNISDLHHFFLGLDLPHEKKKISEKLIKEITNRLNFLVKVGLDYLNLLRNANSLSGGENQRLSLATQMGSALSGVLYVLDEPSIGLHQKDNNNLIKTFVDLRDLGNTVLVIEHDHDTINSADCIIDMGPAAGIHGGQITSQGNKQFITNDENSLTGLYLSKKKIIPIPQSYRDLNKKIFLKKATCNNIVDLNVEIPLEGLVCITGVSGSGKSTLLHEILVPAIKKNLSKSETFFTSNYHSITGIDQINSIAEMDQSPIGRTPHSNPATYCNLFDDIRSIFAQTVEAKTRGYKPGRFSFNVKGGRCEECEGNGVKKIEMHFLPDIYITCSECDGTRYNQETLSILYKKKNIADVLDMTINEACEFFKNHKRINRIITTLVSVGLGYIKLGQSATTLSGGEAQRLKLSRELSKSKKGHCLYVLDEPTTGLHIDDIKILLGALNDLVNKGNSVLVIEHNLDVIKCADYIIDLGPDGGNDGGKVVATGTPEEIIKNFNSHTAVYLKQVMDSNK
ncbi:MAG: excinuclease ABC subunit UvrA [Bacteriovoracaceae bacterium]|nr:excinuclease ABC subunit UvrA [Bacteriovoracaceae bacterium]